MSVHKKIQPNRSSRLAGYTQHIYIYMNVLFYYIDYLSILYLFYTILFDLKNNNIFPNPLNNSYFENSGFVFSFEKNDEYLIG